MLFHPTNDSYMHNMHMPLKSISSHGFFPPTKTSKISPSRKDSDSVCREQSESQCPKPHHVAHTGESDRWENQWIDMDRLGTGLQHFWMISSGVFLACYGTFTPIWRTWDILKGHIMLYKSEKDLTYSKEKVELENMNQRSYFIAVVSKGNYHHSLSLFGNGQWGLKARDGMCCDLMYFCWNNVQ